MEETCIYIYIVKDKLKELAGPPQRGGAEASMLGVDIRAGAKRGRRQTTNKPANLMITVPICEEI